MAEADIQVEDQRDDVPFFVHSEVDDYPFDPYEFRAYSRLCRRAGNTQGQAYESVEHMAAGCKMSPRKLRYCLDVLEACRFVSRMYRIGQTTVIKLLPRKEWAPAKAYELLRAQALATDPGKRPKHKTKPLKRTVAPGAVPSETGTDIFVPAPHAAPFAPGAAKGFPLEVLPVDDGEARARRLKPTGTDELLPTSERSTRGFQGGYELKLGGNVKAQRAWNAVLTASDHGGVTAAGRLIDDHLELFVLLADARAQYRPHNGAFCIWVTEIERDLRLSQKAQVANNLKRSFEKAATDFLEYYRTLRNNPRPAKTGRGFSKSSRRAQPSAAEADKEQGRAKSYRERVAAESFAAFGGKG